MSGIAPPPVTCLTRSRALSAPTLALGAAMTLAALAPAQAHAGVFVVNNGNDWDSNGICNALSCTLRDAADAVRASSDPHDEIQVEVTSTLYRTGTDDDNTAGDIDLCKTDPGGSVTIKGVGAVSALWTGQTQESERDRVFHVPLSTETCFTVDLRIETLSVGNGRVVDQADGGGCVASHGDTLELVESAVIDCKVTNTGSWGPTVPGGGGVQAHGELRVESSNLRLNEAIEANGGAIEALGDLSIDGSFVFLNEVTTTGAAARGGGIHAPAQATVSIEGSRIYDNAAPGEGGGLWLAPAHLRILDTEVFDNEVTLGAGAGGGGLYLVNPEDQGADPIIERSLFAGNQASTTNARGGGVFFAGAANDPLRVHNTTFSGNAGDFGGALFVGTEAMVVEVHHGTFHVNTAGNNDDVARVEGLATLTYEASLVNGRCNGGGTVTTVGYSVVRDFGGGPQCPFDGGLGDVPFSFSFPMTALTVSAGGTTRYHRPTGSFVGVARMVDGASCLAQDQRSVARPAMSPDCVAGSMEEP